MSDAMSPLPRYSAVASAAADQVIRGYSTSFGWATRLLGARVRSNVRNVYALVRVADEVVDGVGAAAGLDREGCRVALDRLAEETVAAMRSGFSTNLVVHAFATTARRCGIGTSLTDPFFVSMRRDLDGGEHSPASRLDYVYGSAQVVGLMCLRTFLAGQSTDAITRDRLEQGALRLGAAFQHVNFLRDLADDTGRLGRRYLGDRGPWGIDAAAKRAWVEAVRADLAAARATVPLLPADCRLGVRCALELFGALTDRIDRTPLEQLLDRRVRLPAARKAAVVLRALAEVRG